MAYDVDYDDLDYGDEVRGEDVETVGLPHDESGDGISEGTPVAFNGTKIVAADGNSSLPVIGVLYTYQYYGENNSVRQDRNATVLVGGKVKARVAGGSDTAASVNAGEWLGVNEDGTGDVGVFDSDTGSQYASFVALTDARQQDDGNPNGGTGESYAEVLVR